MKSIKFSLFAYTAAVFMLAYASLIYYPKWKVNEGECVLSWDVSGYYFYLPAIFIYKDIKQLRFKDKIFKDYNPTPELQQAFLHKESGNYVMKYSCGQALHFLPAFLTAHLYAKNSHFPADGFSKPYQAAIVLWTLLTSLIGLWFARKILLRYFDDVSTGVALLLLLIGTNYLNYASMDSAMTHSFCFTLLAILTYATIRFYETAAWKYTIVIGICVGWAALTRPTEIIMALIPLLWGVFDKNTLMERFDFFKNNNLKILLAVFLTIFIGSIQLIYWKYATGHWIVYSYEDQGFSWLKPHLEEGFFSFRAGWLMYSPMMYFALLGFVPLFYKNKNIAVACLIYSILFIYIAFAWDCWWYGGSLGQRSMVQAYTILLFPLTAFITWFFTLFSTKSILKKYVLSSLIVILAVFFSYVSLWFTHQAHKGGFFAAGDMNKKFYYAVLGHWNLKKDAYKLLDTDEYFYGTPQNAKTLYFNDFDTDTLSIVDGQNKVNKLLFIDEWNQFSKIYKVKNEGIEGNWLRMSADFRFPQQEWNQWKMLQMQIAFVKDGKKIKDKAIRVQRYYAPDPKVPIYIDTKIPKEDFDAIHLSFWNGEGKTTTYIDNLKLESFHEK